VISQTEIIHGSENVVDRLVQFTYRAQLRIDVCVDNTRPGLAVEIRRLKDTFIDAKRRHVKVRYITEITKDNFDYCKELISIVDELRHLDGIKGNFYVSEFEYAAPSTLHELWLFSCSVVLVSSVDRPTFEGCSIASNFLYEKHEVRNR
jgi:two-component system, OmpR family, sensor histidine kinase VicK